MEIKPIKLTTPLTKAEISSLNVGDVIELSGVIYTARDAAHQRIQDNVNNDAPQPFEIRDQIIFYVGPTPSKPGKVIGSAAPTTSLRMDKFVETMLKLGLLGMIGKEERADYVAELCKDYGAVYFLSIGGASAMIANQIKSCDVIAYEDLGTESIKRMVVENMRLIVGIDTKGRVFQDEQVAKYRIMDQQA